MRVYRVDTKGYPFMEEVAGQSHSASNRRLSPKIEGKTCCFLTFGENLRRFRPFLEEHGCSRFSLARRKSSLLGDPGLFLNMGQTARAHAGRVSAAYRWNSLCSTGTMISCDTKRVWPLMCFKVRSAQPLCPRLLCLSTFQVRRGTVVTQIPNPCDSICP